MWEHRRHRRLMSPYRLLALLLLLSAIPHLYAVDFLFNGFRPSDLLLYGDATLFPPTAAASPSTANSSSSTTRYLAMTNVSEFSVGRALYKSKVPMTSPNSTTILPFATSFIFSIGPISGTLPGHGIAFLFSPHPGIQGPPSAQAAQHLGLFNRTIDGDPNNGVVAVEFDVFENEEFHDIDNNHVGIDVYSLTSKASESAGFWPDDGSRFVPLKINDGSNYQAWVDYNNGRLNVTMARLGMMKPRRPLVTLDRDLSSIFQKEMYLGFCGATGRLVENHRVLGWSFSNSNLSLSEALVTSDLPNFVPPQVASRSKGRTAGVIAGVTAAVAFVSIVVVGLIVLRKRRRGGKGWRRRKDGGFTDEEGNDGSDGSNAPMEAWESEYWPHRVGYRDIMSATGGFAEQTLVGSGGNGKVYKGVLGGTPVAVKLFSHSTGEEAREFLSEVSTLGRLQHRNLVGLKGWCRRRSGDLMLIYEYMENGSLDKRIFLPDAWGNMEGSSATSVPLDWATRVRILKDVAAGVLYLHEGWESRVLHRDIKASNVMLDGDMVARLGDFGLARVHAHGGVPRTTRVVGTVGYMAPEIMRNGKATAATDVFGFGVLVLEVVCGRRAIIEEDQEDNRGNSSLPPSPPLVEWAWGLVEKGDASAAVDPRVRDTDGFDEEEAIGTLRLGLWCSCGDPAVRPTMRQVVSVWNGGWMASTSEKQGHVSSADAYLVEKLRTATPPPPWCAPSSYLGALGLNPNYRHPTFEELRLSSSMSLSSSSTILEGR